MRIRLGTSIFFKSDKILIFRPKIMTRKSLVSYHGTNLPDMWRKSGKTQEEFSREYNLSVHKLRYWLYKKKDFVQTGDAFLELGFPAFGEGFLIRYPNGVELSAPAVTPVSTLKALISQ